MSSIEFYEEMYNVLKTNGMIRSSDKYFKSKWKFLSVNAKKQVECISNYWEDSEFDSAKEFVVYIANRCVSVYGRVSINNLYKTVKAKDEVREKRLKDLEEKSIRYDTYEMSDYSVDDFLSDLETAFSCTDGCCDHYGKLFKIVANRHLYNPVVLWCFEDVRIMIRNGTLVLEYPKPVIKNKYEELICEEEVRNKIKFLFGI